MTSNCLGIDAEFYAFSVELYRVVAGPNNNKMATAIKVILKMKITIIEESNVNEENCQLN